MTETAKLVIEPAIISGALLLYIIYHIFLGVRYCRNPLSTTLGQNYAARHIWVECVMRERRDVLAVQTLRNTLMSSSLLASTSLTLSAVVAAYLVNTVKEEGGIDFLAAPYLHPIHKFFVVIVCFAMAFFFYMQSVRAANHAGYMISLPLMVESPYNPEYVFRVLEKGALFNTAGTRMFYLAFLSVIWIFGPLPAVIATLILIASLWRLDRVDSHLTSIDPLNLREPLTKKSPSDNTNLINRII